MAQMGIYVNSQGCTVGQHRAGVNECYRDLSPVMVDNERTAMNESLAKKDFSAAYALLEEGHREEGTSSTGCAISEA
jgi:hypothetical protein